MLPAQAISQPLFSIFKTLGLYDTKLGLIIVYAAMGIPMSFFVMTSYYKTIPLSLEESAYIDGATFIQTFTKIVLPLAKPGFATIAMLQFINTWNEFYFALMLTSGDKARTVPIALNYYLGTFANNYSALFSGGSNYGITNNYILYHITETSNGKFDSRSSKRIREGDCSMGANTYPIEEWVITEEKFLKEWNYRNETTFALSNGYIGTRGTFDEGYPFTVDEGLEGNFINGFYESEHIMYGEWNFGFPEKSQSLLNLPKS